jgi:hypothetical protein
MGVHTNTDTQQPEDTMKNERTRHLKLKIVNLADEARNIRREQRKVLKKHRRQHGDANGKLPSGAYIPAQNLLHEHRVGIVRGAARANLLAYAYVRGIPYQAAEQKTNKPFPLKNVQSVVKTFGGDHTGVEEWRRTVTTPLLVAVG